MLRHLSLSIGISLIFATAEAAAPAPPPRASSAVTTIESGEIGGALFSLARPARWNRRLLLLAHGLRSESKPLNADLGADRLARKTLIDEGWMVATTSFRRNGLIVADAVADLDALRAHIAAKFGEPERVLLEGDSLGGLIVTLMAERDPRDVKRYDGAIAIGPALDVREPASAIGLTLQPRMPLIFLANRTEIQGPQSYVESKIALEEPALRPVLFRVARDGHVNVNQRERLLALRALNLWLDRGRAALPQPAVGAAYFDASCPPEPPASVASFHPDRRGFETRVIHISPDYGNVTLEAQPADFAAAGIGRMARFQFTAHEQSYRVVYGRDFDSVKRGEWVAIPDADGFLLLARNYGDAAATARLSLGDVVTVRSYAKPE